MQISDRYLLYIQAKRAERIWMIFELEIWNNIKLLFPHGKIYDPREMDLFFVFHNKDRREFCIVVVRVSVDNNRVNKFF